VATNDSLNNCGMAGDASWQRDSSAGATDAFKKLRQGWSASIRRQRSLDARCRYSRSRRSSRSTKWCSARFCRRLRSYTRQTSVNGTSASSTPTWQASTLRCSLSTLRVGSPFIRTFACRDALTLRPDPRATTYESRGRVRTDSAPRVDCRSLSTSSPPPSVRRRPAELALTNTERQALSELREKVHERFGARLRELLLFGSRARGEGDADSDLDVAIVVDGLTGQEGREVGWRCD
jgi:hypothetical protein